MISRPYLVIDGYNFMHAAGMARKDYGPGQLRRCRQQILTYLATHLTAQERERATVVFDASDAPPGLPRESTFAEMTVRFASPGKEADDTIEEIVAAHSSPRQIRLVSGDHRLQRSAQKRRGTFVDSDEFFDTLERRGVTSSAPSAESNQDWGSSTDASTDATETADWLRVFGEIPEAAQIAPEAAAAEQIDLKAMRAQIDREDEAAQSGHPVPPRTIDRPGEPTV